jgi:hypothetical protein
MVNLSPTIHCKEGGGREKTFDEGGRMMAIIVRNGTFPHLAHLIRQGAHPL